MHVVSCTQRWYIITTGDESGIADNLQGYFSKVLSHVHATKSDSDNDTFRQQKCRVIPVESGSRAIMTIGKAMIRII